VAVNSLFARPPGSALLLDRGFWAVDFPTSPHAVRPISCPRSGGPKLRPIRGSRRPDDSFLAGITNPKTKQPGRSASLPLPDPRIVTAGSRPRSSTRPSPPWNLSVHYYLRWEGGAVLFSMKVHQCPERPGSVRRSYVQAPNLVEQKSLRTP